MSLDQRALTKWPGYTFAPGYTIEFRVRFLQEDLRKFAAEDDSRLTWVPAPGMEMAREVALISGPPMAPGAYPKCASAETTLLWQVDLPNQLRAWAVSYLTPRPSREWVEGAIGRVRAAIPEIDPTHRTQGLRLMLGFELDDGSAGWVDIAGDRLLDE